MKPTETGSSCGCGGSPIEVHNDDTRYKFDFSVEEPKPSETEREM